MDTFGISASCAACCSLQAFLLGVFNIALDVSEELRGNFQTGELRSVVIDFKDSCALGHMRCVTGFAEQLGARSFRVK